MKSSQIFLECERFLKRALKDKGQYTKGAVIAFLITGGIGVSMPSTVHAVIPPALLGLAFEQAGRAKGDLYSTDTDEITKKILAKTPAELGLTMQDLYSLFYHTPLATKATDFYGTQKPGAPGSKPLNVNRGYVTYEGANITGGENTFVRGSGAIALGGSSKADGTGTVAIGQYSDASSKINGYDSQSGYTYAPGISDNVAIGFRSESHADYTVALGAKAAANESGSNALGYNTQATGKSSLAIGYNTFANTKASATNNLESTIKGLTGSLSPESITQVNEYYAKLADFVDAQKNYNEAVAAKDTANIQKYSNLVRQYRNEVSAKKTALDKIPGVKDLISSTGVESNDTELKKALETTGGVSNLINKSLNEGLGTNLKHDHKKAAEK